MRTKTVSYSLNLPTIDIDEIIVRLKKLFALLSSKFKINELSNFSQQAPTRVSRFKFPSGRTLSKLPLRRISRFAMIAAVILLVVFLGGRLVSGLSKPDDIRQEVAGATASKEINKEFTFPLRNGNGEEVSRLKYTIENAELRNEIVVQGQRATAVRGREFLVFTLKITNEFDQAIEIDTRDYVRLSVNENEEEWLAPDIHNDPVEVQAISTKYTRVGFPINDTDRDLVLRVGEIDGDKEKIALELR